ncbi:DUF1700 domain-containing protein [Sporanaerobacter acetigenes]|uniref:Uncharacterized membrane protein n=1 Tax=Sporanaerobacter acetigenes DSM 13106 TaxID=1123281 RepID=A0A1M5X5G6_9FIRM|nr:DUF1700 domain-containing protein [Sporanaerobacter acetigenes]SHH95067.1 Uncharacterized membrane protein [Sporanaerobacter acetigenes DSM 13106]
MNRKEFIGTLRANLKGLPQEEIDDIIYDYEEHFRIGLSQGKFEEDIARELGDPRNIAKMYKVSSKIDEAESNPSPKNLLKAMFSAMALGIFNFIIVLGPFIVIIALLIGLYGISVGLVAGGIGAVFGTILIPLSCYPFSYYDVNLGVHPVTSVSLGIGLTCLGVLLFMASLYLTKLLYKGTVKYLKWNIDTIKK